MMIVASILLGLCFAAFLAHRRTRHVSGHGRVSHQATWDNSSTSDGGGHWSLFLGSHAGTLGSSAHSPHHAHDSHDAGSHAHSGHDCSCDCSCDSSCGCDGGDGGCDGGGGSD